MSQQFYRKELASNPFLVGGAAVQFEILDGNRGCIAVDDADTTLITALNAAAAKRRGGIVKITEGEYRHIKAVHPFNPSAPKLQKDVLRALPPSIKPAAQQFRQTRGGAFNPVAGVAPAAAPAVKTAEAQVAVANPPKHRFQPPTRRISRKEALGEDV